MKQLEQRLTELEQAQPRRKHAGEAMQRICARLDTLAKNLRTVGPIEAEAIPPERIAEMRALVVQGVARYASY